MYASPTLVNFQSLFDLIFKALQKHPQDRTYTVILGKTVIPKGTDGTDVYRTYGPCGPCPFYYLRFFTEDGKVVDVDQPYSYMSVSKETLDNIPNLDETTIDDFSGNSFLFTPANHQKSEMFDDFEPVKKKNQFVEWAAFPEVCLDKEGKLILRTDQY